MCVGGLGDTTRLRSVERIGQLADPDIGAAAPRRYRRRRRRISRAVEFHGHAGSPSEPHQVHIDPVQRVACRRRRDMCRRCSWRRSACRVTIARYRARPICRSKAGRSGDGIQRSRRARAATHRRSAALRRHRKAHLYATTTAKQKACRKRLALRAITHPAPRTSGARIAAKNNHLRRPPRLLAPKRGTPCMACFRARREKLEPAVNIREFALPEQIPGMALLGKRQRRLAPQALSYASL